MRAYFKSDTPSTAGTPSTPATPTNEDTPIEEVGGLIRPIGRKNCEEKSKGVSHKRSVGSNDQREVNFMGNKCEEQHHAQTTCPSAREEGGCSSKNC